MPGLTGEFITDDTADLSLYPKVLPLTERRESTEVTFADQHANVVRTVYELIKENVIILPEADYLALIEIYNTIFPEFPMAIDLDEEATVARLRGFRDIISRISLVEPRIKLVRFIGDILCDRGQFDYFIIHLLGHLAGLGLPMRFILSNHDLEFLQDYQSGVLDGSFSRKAVEGEYRSLSTLALALKPPGIAASAPRIGIAAAVEEILAERLEQTATQKAMAEEIRRVIDTIYLPNLRAIDYAYSVAASDDGDEISKEQVMLFIHALAMYNILIMAADFAGVKWQVDSPAHLIATIDAVNNYFHENFASRPDGFLNEAFKDGDDVIPKRMNSPFFRLAWDREYGRMDYPKRLGAGPGFGISIVHGHQPMVVGWVAENEIPLDTTFGEEFNIVPKKTLRNSFRQVVSALPKAVVALMLGDGEKNKLWRFVDAGAAAGAGGIAPPVIPRPPGFFIGGGDVAAPPAAAMASVSLAAAPAVARASLAARATGGPTSPLLSGLLAVARRLEEARGRPHAEHGAAAGGDGAAGYETAQGKTPSGM